MKKYFRNISLLIILACIGCFVSVGLFAFCFVVLVLSPLLAFHIQTILKNSKDCLNENR